MLLKLAIWGFVAASSPDRFSRADSASYHDSARALLSHGRFAISPEEPDRPQAWRTPGYPLLLAAVYALTGERPAAAVAAQIPIGLATIAVAALIATSRWSSSRVGLLAAVLLALDLNSTGFSLLLLSETLFTLAVALALLAGIGLQRSDGR
jgi:4-amino-4-deoxy-L-arabinose transferase-like glycosyltransferase